MTTAPLASLVVTLNDAGTPDNTGGVMSAAAVKVAVHDLSASMRTKPLAHAAAFGPLQPTNAEADAGVADTGIRLPTM